jgi:hypothetical protein
MNSSWVQRCLINHQISSPASGGTGRKMYGLVIKCLCTMWWTLEHEVKSISVFKGVILHSTALAATNTHKTHASEVLSPTAYISAKSAQKSQIWTTELLLVWFTFASASNFSSSSWLVPLFPAQ